MLVVDRHKKFFTVLIIRFSRHFSRFFSCEKWWKLVGNAQTDLIPSKGGHNNNLIVIKHTAGIKFPKNVYGISDFPHFEN